MSCTLSILSLGPLIYYNGSRHILVGVSSFVVGSCGTIGVTDGFARVTNQIDWIRENSDNYVRTCSARIRSGIKSVVIEIGVGMIKMAKRKATKKFSLPARYFNFNVFCSSPIDFVTS